MDVERSPESTAGEFRLHVRRGDASTTLDLAHDWRDLDPVALEVGPVLAVDDAVGSKVTA